MVVWSALVLTTFNWFDPLQGTRKNNKHLQGENLRVLINVCYDTTTLSRCARDYDCKSYVIIFTWKVINTDGIHKEIEEYSGLTHDGELLNANFRKCFESKRQLTKRSLTSNYVTCDKLWSVKPDSRLEAWISEVKWNPYRSAGEEDRDPL